MKYAIGDDVYAIVWDGKTQKHKIVYTTIIDCDDNWYRLEYNNIYGDDNSVSKDAREITILYIDKVRDKITDIRRELEKMMSMLEEIENITGAI